jgi:hypothetical protein
LTYFGGGLDDRAAPGPDRSEGQGFNWRACQFGELVLTLNLDPRGGCTAADGLHTGNDAPQWAHEQSGADQRKKGERDSRNTRRH